MNAVIFLVNLLTRGDYGFFRRPPIIGDHGALFELLLNQHRDGGWYLQSTIPTNTRWLKRVLFRVRNRKRVDEGKKSWHFGDLFFYQSTNIPPSIGVWYFLLPTSLVVVGVLSVRFAPPKLPNLFGIGTVDPVAHHQLLVFSSSLAFSESLPFYHSRMAMWIILWPQGKLQAIFCPRGSLWLHYGPWFILFLSPTLFSRFPRSTMSLVTGPSWHTA